MVSTAPRATNNATGLLLDGAGVPATIDTALTALVAVAVPGAAPGPVLTTVPALASSVGPVVAEVGPVVAEGSPISCPPLGNTELPVAMACTRRKEARDA